MLIVFDFKKETCEYHEWKVHYVSHSSDLIVNFSDSVRILRDDPT